jgi:hypothetical protein
MQNA